VAGTGIRSLGSIGPLQYGDDGVITKFTIRVAEDAADGEYDIKVAYRVSGGVWVSKEISGINIQSSEAIISVASTELTPERIAPGSSGKLSVVLKNYATSAMRDVVAALNLEGTKFSPLNTTNVQVIVSLDSKEEAQLSYNLFPEPDAESKVHPIVLTLSYRDSLGKIHNRNETIGIPVFSKPDYEINVEEANAYTRDSNGEVVLSISNTGTSNIKFWGIELLEADDYTVISSPKAYVGNLESDDFETASFDLHISKAAKEEVVLKVKLTYKDDYNYAYEELQEVSFNIYSKSEAKRYELVPTKNIMITLIWFVVEVILIVFAVFMLIDCVKRQMPRYKKILWTILVLTVIGAFIYYFVGRKKQ
jgi:hypothetical protein